MEFSQNLPSTSVPALVIDVDESSIRQYLDLSNQLPVLILFSGGAEPDGAKVKEDLAALTNEAGGRLITLVVDAMKAPALVKAFEVQSLPSVMALLKGQPAPLFSGLVTKEQLTAVISRVLEVASQNSLTGKVVVESEPQEAELSQTHLQAFEAIDQGDYPKAMSLYERALVENPNDSLAEAGLAQVKLLNRLMGKNVEEIITLEGKADVFDLADAYIATGQPELSFQVLLEEFEKREKALRDPYRLRLLELFLTVGLDDPAVVEARKKLSLLLF